MDIFDAPDFVGKANWSDVYADAGPQDVVFIEKGQRVRIDQDIDVEGLIIEGQLIAQDRQDLEITTDWALAINGGKFRVGWENDPFEHEFTLTLDGDSFDQKLDFSNVGLSGPIDPTMMLRGNGGDAFLMAMGEGSQIEIHGQDQDKASWTQLRATAEIGDNSLLLAERTDWKVGDRIAIASTSGNMTEAEERVITRVSADGRQVWLDDALDHRHYGEIETYDNGKAGDEFQEWDIDMRGEVALLSRNVTITGDDNADRDQMGGHVMTMMGAEMRINGAEFTKMGQAGELGRYAAHWHMLGDAEGQYIANSSFHETYNKGFTVHGTDNTLIENNVVYNTIGHGIFFEDGSETGNVVKDNLVFSTFRADRNNAAIPTDFTDVSSYWIEHPNNVLIGNHAAGSADTAFFILGPDKPHGLSTGQFVPGDMSDLVFRDNAMHSSKQGLFIDGKINPNNLKWGNGVIQNSERFVIEDTTAYKITGDNRGAIWVRSSEGIFDNVMAADNNEAVFMNSDNLLRNSVIVARSEGNTEAWQNRTELTGTRIYIDGAAAVQDTHFVNFTRDGDTALGIRLTTDRDPSYVEGLTFENTDKEEQFAWFTKAGRDNALKNIRSEDVPDELNHNAADNPRIRNKLIDIDGSLTGEAGTMLTAKDPGEAGVRRDTGWESWLTELADAPTWEEAMDQMFVWR